MNTLPDLPGLDDIVGLLTVRADDSPGY